MSGMTVHDLARRLPDPVALRDLCRAIAMLEAVLAPGRERRHTFHTGWSETEDIASMRSGGDEFDIVFSPAGVWMRGFDHESPMSPCDEDVPWPGVLDTVPAAFRHCVEEPAFSENGIPSVTCCLWRETGDTQWRAGEIEFPVDEADPDGSGWMFGLLTSPAPEAFASFATHHYGVPVPLDPVRHVYAGRPLDSAVVAALNPAASPAALAEEAAGIGYPAVLDPPGP